MSVTFGLNVRLDLSRKATTKSLSSLGTQPGLEILGESAGTVAVWMIRGVRGRGRYPRRTWWFRGVSEVPCNKLDWHKNSDLRSKFGTSTVLNTTARCLIESVVLLTKSIGIWTPLVLSIVVVVALRLISYKARRKEPSDRIVQEPPARSRQIVSYMGYGVRNEKKRKRGSPTCLRKWCSPIVTMRSKTKSTCSIETGHESSIGLVKG